MRSIWPRSFPTNFGQPKIGSLSWRPRFGCIRTEPNERKSGFIKSTPTSRNGLSVARRRIDVPHLAHLPVIDSSAIALILEAVEVSASYRRQNTQTRYTGESMRRHIFDRHPSLTLGTQLTQSLSLGSRSAPNSISDCAGVSTGSNRRAGRYGRAACDQTVAFERDDRMRAID